MTFRTVCTSNALQTIKKILKSEDITATYEIYEDAVGDTVIEVTGNKEDMLTLRDIYRMVCR